MRELWRGLRLEEITLAHPGALHVRHTQREERHGRYLALVEGAAADPGRTPRGLMMLGFELVPRDPDRAIMAFQRYLDEGHDAIEGEPNGFRWIVLDHLARASAGVSRSAEAALYARERDDYTWDRAVAERNSSGAPRDARLARSSNSASPTSLRAIPTAPAAAATDSARPARGSVTPSSRAG